MRRNLLTWLLLMILSSLAITNSSFQLEPHQGHVSNLSLSRLQGQETIHEEEYGRGSNKEKGDLSVVSDKGQKGKTGVYGGGNSGHRPRQQKSSATPRPDLIPETMLHVSFSLVLMILFFKLL